MGTINLLMRVAGAVLFLIVLLLVLGQLLGTPILLSYVTTGSMTGTINPGEGFIAVPIQVAGPVHVGDVVTYRAERLHGGGLTTHRIVGKTKQGFITKGDANPSTDQAGKEPPVKHAQIVAKALQVNGHVVVIPGLGTAVMAFRSALTAGVSAVSSTFSVAGLGTGRTVAFGLFGLSVVGYAADWLLNRQRGDEREYSRSRSRDTGLDAHRIVLGLVLIVVLVSTAAMVVPSGPQKFGFVSSTYDAPGASVIPMGQTETTTLHLSNGGFVPEVAYLQADGGGVRVEPPKLSLGPRGTAAATVQLTAPEQTGYFRRFVTVHEYFALLPESVIETLYNVHPWMPIVVIDAVIGVPLYVLGTLLVGSGRIRTRAVERPSTTRRILNRLS